ncbi:MAG: hypothetical protein E6J81_16330 [Deltaproteobacteria bacterium]|nr:MAG: hypothetical protein E6J81_16330 [Deltaproteobacteria bacterium]
MHPHANWRKACRRVTAALILWAAAARGDQLEPVSSAASEALALCNDADQAPVSARSALLAHGLERAEEAVSADPQDAVAHFAVFCNLGKRLQMKRDALGLFATLGELGRAQKEIDITTAIFVIVTGLLTYSLIRFRSRRRDDGSEPPQTEYWPHLLLPRIAILVFVLHQHLVEPGRASA